MVHAAISRGFDVRLQRPEPPAPNPGKGAPPIGPPPFEDSPTILPPPLDRPPPTKAPRAEEPLKLFPGEKPRPFKEPSKRKR
jgi:hypothetical protein